MKKSLFSSLLLFILLLTSCSEENETTSNTTQQNNNLFIVTADGIPTAVTYTPLPDAEKAVLLLHMLGRDKTDYETLTKYLNYHNFTVLAIDFRGHGNSKLDYTTFTEKDWQNLVLDVQAGIDVLEAQGYTRIAVVGASIGANAALKQAVQDPRIDTLVLLSAGESYRGINATAVASFYDRPVLFLASYADTDAAVAATRLFNAVNTDAKNIKLYQEGHGTEILDLYGEVVAEEILAWLQESY